MEKIKFLDGTIIEASISFDRNLCTIGSPDVPSDTKRIELVDDWGSVYGAYTGYKTVYRKTEEFTQLSNDGSVWSETPHEPEPDVEENGVELPSLEERVNDLEIAVCELADAIGLL